MTASAHHGPVDRIALHKERDRIGQRGLWVASCAVCGYELRVSLRQATAELARWRRCPVCGTRAARPRRPTQRTTR